MKTHALAAVLLLPLAGCFTVSQTDYPVVTTSRAPEGAPAVALSGFEASYTKFIPIQSYATVWAPGPGYYHHGRYYRGGAHPETVSSTTYLPQTEVSTAYVEKAQDLLEKAGYTVSPTNATRVIDVSFSGPTVTDADRSWEFFSVIATLTLADRTTALYSARLRITDSASGKLLLSQDLTQPYLAWSLSPIPLFGPLSAETVQSDYIKNWCLSALTDRAISAATSFLSAVK